MTTLIADCETSGFMDDPNLRFHMLQLGDADGDDAVIYADMPQAQIEDVAERKLLMSPIRPIAEGLARIAAADMTVWHNGLGFDFWAVNHFFPGTLARPKMYDTLVMARLAEPNQRDHTLRAWGNRLGVLKGDYHGDFQHIDDDLLTYSEQDVIVGRGLWHKVKHVIGWGESCALEHDTAWTLRLQELNGFKLNVREAETLAGVLRDELSVMAVTLKAVFPPLVRREVFLPKRDNRTLGYQKGVPFAKESLEDFNPRSRQHCAERLIMAGWKPTVQNDDGTWKLDEAVLKSLPFPEAKTLLSYFATNKMLAQLSDGKEGWLRHVKPDGRVHGRVNPNGAVTGRMSHSKPNMANIDKDPRMRGLWEPRDGWDLVGCDAEGLEARMLAHYLFKWDHGRYAQTVLEGSSKNRTDVHSANIKQCIKVGLLPMDVWKDPVLFDKARNNTGIGVKTMLYGMMYGAQDKKLGDTIRALRRELGLRPLGPASNELGALFRKAVGASIIGFNELTEAVKERAKTRGYLLGLDGRHMPVRSQHSALNTLLQGGGAIVMKKSQSIWTKQFDAEGWVNRVVVADEGLLPHYGICANIHDEWQIEAAPSISTRAGELMADSIRLAGEHFKLACPLAGKATIGKTWAETH